MAEDNGQEIALVSKATNADVMNAVLGLQVQIARQQATTSAELKHINERMGELRADFKELNAGVTNTQRQSDSNRAKIDDLQGDVRSLEGATKDITKKYDDLLKLHNDFKTEVKTTMAWWIGGATVAGFVLNAIFDNVIGGLL